MTDFFTRLAERALGLATVIQPITASMFEPIQGISIQNDALDIMLEEKSQSEETDYTSGVEIAGILPPLQKPEEELVAGTLQQFETSMREPIASTLPPLEIPEREPIANALPLLEKPASVPRAGTQEPRNALVPGERATLTSPDQPGSQGSLLEESPDGISPTTTHTSSVNEVHIHSEFSTSLQNRLERGEAQRPVPADVHVARFPGTGYQSSPVAPASTMPVASNIPTRETQSAVPFVAPPQLAEIAQLSAAVYPRAHSEREYPRTKAVDTQRIVLETRIMQSTPVTNALNSQQTPFLEERKRQSIPEQPASLQHSPAQLASDPAIQVTIGRIEVRATPAPTPPASPQRQHSAPAVMSLDDYLRQSARGGR